MAHNCTLEHRLRHGHTGEVFHPGRTLVRISDGQLQVPSLHNWEHPISPPQESPVCCEGEVVQGPTATGKILSKVVIEPKSFPVTETIRKLESQADQIAAEIKSKTAKAHQEMVAQFEKGLQQLQEEAIKLKEKENEALRRRFWDAKTETFESVLNTIIKPIFEAENFSNCQQSGSVPASQIFNFKSVIPISTLSKRPEGTVSESHIRLYQSHSETARATQRTLEEAQVLHNKVCGGGRSRINGDYIDFVPDLPNSPDLPCVQPQHIQAVIPRRAKNPYSTSQAKYTSDKEQDLLVASERFKYEVENSPVRSIKPSSYQNLLQYMSETGSSPLPPPSRTHAEPKRLQQAVSFAPPVDDQPRPTTSENPPRTVVVDEIVPDYLIEDLSAGFTTSKPSLFVSASNFLKTEPQEVTAHGDALRITKDWNVGKSTHFTSESASKVVFANSEENLGIRPLPNREIFPIVEQNLYLSNNSRGQVALSRAPVTGNSSGRATFPKKITPIHLYRQVAKESDPWRLATLRRHLENH